MTRARYSSRFAATADDLFAFHCDPSNLPRISPPLPHVRVGRARAPMQEGDLQEFTLMFGPWPILWHARIARLVPGSVIVDVQERGPFRMWRHSHRVETADSQVWLTDEITFRLWPTAVGEFAEYWLVRPFLLGMLWWRHRRTRAMVAGH